MKQHMKRIAFDERSRSEVLHIECPGCIVNLRVGLPAQDGKRVTSIEVLRDQSCCADDGPDLQWRFLDSLKSNAMNIRVGLVKIRKAKRIKIPRSFPVQPLRRGQKAKDPATCGTCGLTWDDAVPTQYTPTPSARCPFEQFHH